MIVKRNKKDYNKVAKENRLSRGLNAQDKQIIKMICDEKTSIEIGEELELSPRTIENHRYMIMRILDCKSNIGIVKYAIANGLYTIHKTLSL